MRYRIEYCVPCDSWMIYKWNPIAESWEYKHTEATKSLAIAWTEKNSF